MQRILIVDDEPFVREVVTQILEKFFPKAEVIGASDADEAMRVLNEKEVHVALIDFSLPGESGIVLCTKIREVNHRIVLYAFSGYLDAVSRVDVDITSIGFNGAYGKPIQQEVLVEAVNNGFKLYEESHE